MRIGIIGGGITGLALTHALARLGVDSILFERSEEVGGVIRTVRPGGRVVELGPQRTRLVAPVRRLVDELGLGAELLHARPGAHLFIWARGRLRVVPSHPGALLTGDLLSPAGRLRAALEPLTAGLRDGESVARYFRRKVGAEAYRRLFGPLVSATFGSDPETMPAARVLPMILDPLGVRRSLLAAARRRPPRRGRPGVYLPRRHGHAALRARRTAIASASASRPPSRRFGRAGRASRSSTAARAPAQRPWTTSCSRFRRTRRPASSAPPRPPPPTVSPAFATTASRCARSRSRGRGRGSAFRSPWANAGAREE